ncbi:MAG: CvpA family protein [Christensenellales bacterium]
MNVLDIILVVFIAIVGLIGFSKGFIKTMLSLIGSVLSWTAAYFVAKPLVSLMDNIFNTTNKIASHIIPKITPYFTEFENKLGSEILSENCSAGGILKTAFKFFINPDTVYENSTTLTTNLGNFLAGIAVFAICMIVAFILIKLAILILSKIFDALKKDSPAFSGLDRLLGFIFGLAKSLVFIAVIFLIANLVQGVPQIATFLDKVFEGSTVAKPLYDFTTNILSKYISKFDVNSMLAKIM